MTLESRKKEEWIPVSSTAFVFEAKPAIAFNTLPSQNVCTVVRYVLE
ncbi:hypothetical protein [Wolbachia pipientis]|nr:hypothetical protein [Wolbachia pipientis]